MPQTLLALFDRLAQYETLLWWAAAVSTAVFLAGLVIIPWAIVRLPPDYFAHQRPPARKWAQWGPVLRVILLAAKNLLGAALLLAGVVMLFWPGPGIVALLVGLSLMDFPGKRELERRVVRQPRVFRAFNRIRARYGRPPFEYPQVESGAVKVPRR